SAGVPVGVLTAPMIPALNDHELPSLIDQAARAGARYAGYVMLRLPHGVKELFARWLETHFPGKKEKVLNRIRAVRGGNLNDPRFSSRMKGEGIFAGQIAEMFALACRKSGIAGNKPELTADNFINNCNRQLSLF
ncbi:MAG: radical SAM protein, partial [Nitrospinae bacterium]|nr:radical SAM protein [Nitrospinota bacterium]